MAQNEIHLGDIGTVFEVTLKDGTSVVDISSATNAGDKQIFFKKNDGTTLVKEATFTTDGTDGKIQYTTGTYNYASSATISNGGSSYEVGDILTLSSGTFERATTLQVNSISSTGAITSASIAIQGDYSSTPSNPVSVSGGSGSSATFTMSWTLADDLDISGLWSIQAHIILTTGEWYSDVQKFNVFPNLV